MTIKTRIDHRSITNDRFEIKTGDGEILATVVAKSAKVELEVSTAPSLHIEKPNGFRSDNGGK